MFVALQLLKWKLLKLFFGTVDSSGAIFFYAIKSVAYFYAVD